MPLDQDIEGGHGEREPGMEIRPDAVHDLLEVAHDGQHREHRFHQHALLPLPPRTHFEVAGIPLRGMEGGITQDNHALFELPNQPLKGIVRNIGRGTGPPHHQPPLVQQQTEFAPDNPAMIWRALCGQSGGGYGLRASGESARCRTCQ
jgi:hypothetical protein